MSYFTGICVCCDIILNLRFHLDGIEQLQRNITEMHIEGMHNYCSCKEYTFNHVNVSAVSMPC